MLNCLLTNPIVWLALGVNIVRICGISGEGVSKVFPREDLATRLERNVFVQTSESLRPDANTGGVHYGSEQVFQIPQQKVVNMTTTSLSGKINPETLLFWTSSSAADHLIIQSTGFKKSLTIATNTQFDEYADPNNMTDKRDWVTQPSWYVLDSEGDIGQSAETKQLLSKKTADDLIFVFFFIIEPVVAVAGCVCNTFNIIVLRKQGFGESTSCYLFAMTLADFFFLLFQLVHFIFISLKDYSFSEYVQWATWMHHDWFNRFFLVISGRISNYFVAVLSIERFIAVRFPLSIKFTPISLHPKKIIIGVCVFVSALLVPNIFRTEFAQIHDPYNNTTIMRSTFTTFHNSNQEFYVYYTYFILTFLRVLPVLAVSFFNLGIIIVLRSSNTNLRNMSAGDTKRQIKQSKITRMLVAIAVIFLICILPGLVHSLLSVFYRPYYSDNPNLWQAVRNIFSLFDIINSTVNFIVYIMLSDKFSTIFLNTFCGKFKKRNQAPAPDNTGQRSTMNT